MLHASYARFDPHHERVVDHFRLVTSPVGDSITISVFCDGSKLISVEHKNVFDVHLLYCGGATYYLCVFHEGLGNRDGLTDTNGLFRVGSVKNLRFCTSSSIKEKEINEKEKLQLQLVVSAYNVYTGEMLASELGRVNNPRIFDVGEGLLVSSSSLEHQNSSSSTDSISEVLFIDSQFSTTNLHIVNAGEDIGHIEILGHLYIGAQEKTIVVTWNPRTNSLNAAFIKLVDRALWWEWLCSGLQLGDEIRVFDATAVTSFSRKQLKASICNEGALGMLINIFVYDYTTRILYIIRKEEANNVLKICRKMDGLGGLPIFFRDALPPELHRGGSFPLVLVKQNGQLYIYSSVHKLLLNYPANIIFLRELLFNDNYEVSFVETHGFIGLKDFNCMHLVCEPLIKENAELAKSVLSIIVAVLDSKEFFENFVDLLLSTVKVDGVDVWQMLTIYLKITCGIHQDGENSFISDENSNVHDEVIRNLSCYTPYGTGIALNKSMEHFFLEKCVLFNGTISKQEIAVILFGLHLLNESFLAQERTWPFVGVITTALLLPLSELLLCYEYSDYYQSLLGLKKKTTRAEVNNSKSMLNYLQAITKRFANTGPYIKKKNPPRIFYVVDELIQKIFYADNTQININTICWPSVRCQSNRTSACLPSIVACQALVSLYCQSAIKSLNPPHRKWWCTLIELYTYALFGMGTASPTRYTTIYIQSLRDIPYTFSLGLILPLLKALAIARSTPFNKWGISTLEIIGRYDLTTPYNNNTHYSALAQTHLTKLKLNAVSYESLKPLDGNTISIEEKYRHCWSDSRLSVVHVMLDSSNYISLNVAVDKLESNSSLMYYMAVRGMSLPVARGMLTLGTQNFKLQDTIHIPPLLLDGVTTDGIVVRVDQSIEGFFVVVCSLYELALFHNGCASGLRYMRSRDITRSWLNYQTRDGDDMLGNAGMQMIAGLCGHFRCLTKEDIYHRSATGVSKHPFTVIALLLGLGGSFRGTNDETAFASIKSCAPSLMDTPGELPLEVQTASLIAIGLVRQRSRDGFLTEVLLGEISRLPSDQHYKNRTQYAMGAGIGLGLLHLACGGRYTQGLEGVTDRLLSFLSGARRMDYTDTNCYNRFPGDIMCNKIYEGGYFNKAVCAPAAVMALGLIYLCSGDVFVAKRVAPGPHLDNVFATTADVCLQRVLVSCLISWYDIEPTKDWLYGPLCIPTTLIEALRGGRGGDSVQQKQKENKEKIHPVSTTAAQDKFTNTTVTTTFINCSFQSQSQQQRQQTQNQQQRHYPPAVLRYLRMCYGHMIAGAVLALGLKFAGSMNSEALDIVLSELRGFAKGELGSTGIVMSSIHRFDRVYESCVSACALAAGLIMAGTGDATCLTELRKLYNKPKAEYAFYMSISMGIGFLFLGCGQLTLSVKTDALAALLISVFPMWSRSQEEYLEALRHFYVLAVVPRTLVTRNLLTNESVPVAVDVHVYKASRRGIDMGMTALAHNAVEVPCYDSSYDFNNNNGTRVVVPCNIMKLRTPCLLPPLQTVACIVVASSNEFYPSAVDFHNKQLTNDGDDGVVIGVLPVDNEMFSTATVGQYIYNGHKSHREWHTNLKRTKQAVFLGLEARCVGYFRLLLNDKSAYYSFIRSLQVYNIKSIIAFNAALGLSANISSHRMVKLDVNGRKRQNVAAAVGPGAVVRTKRCGGGGGSVLHQSLLSDQFMVNLKAEVEAYFSPFLHNKDILTIYINNEEHEEKTRDGEEWENNNENENNNNQLLQLCEKILFSSSSFLPKEDETTIIAHYLPHHPLRNHLLEIMGGLSQNNNKNDNSFELVCRAASIIHNAMQFYGLDNTNTLTILRQLWGCRTMTATTKTEHVSTSNNSNNPDNNNNNDTMGSREQYQEMFCLLKAVTVLPMDVVSAVLECTNKEK